MLMVYMVSENNVTITSHVYMGMWMKEWTNADGVRLNVTP